MFPRMKGTDTAIHFSALDATLNPQAPLDSTASPSINADEFGRFLRHAEAAASGEPLSLRSWLHLAEAWRITQALRACRGNRSAAARALGIGRRTLYAKLDKLGITASWGP